MMDLSLAHHIVDLQLHEYGKVRTEYWEKVNSGVELYLTDPNKDEDWFKELMRAAVELAFANTLLVAWTDSGNSHKVSASAIAFIAAQQFAEFGFLESLIYSLRLLKTPMAEEPEDIEPLDEVIVMQQAMDRADGYARTLDRMYNIVKVMGAAATMLRFGGSDGEESCFHCQQYKDKVHPAWWWVKQDAVPPNRRFDCKGYKCLHVLERLDGSLFTI